MPDVRDVRHAAAVDALCFPDGNQRRYNRPVWPRSAAAVILLGACFGGSGDYRCPGAGQQLIEMCLPSPSFVAYRDGSGSWQTPVVANGTYKLCVADDYVLETVYAGSNHFTASAVATTYAETNPVFQECMGAPPAPVQTVAVSGELVQGGQIWIGSAHGGDLPDSGAISYMLDVGVGAHDVVASSDMYGGSPGNVLITRNQDFEAAAVLPDIDLSAMGVPVQQVPIALAGLDPLDVVVSMLALRTSSTYASAISVHASQQSSPTADVVPAAALVPTDEQDLTVSGSLGSGYHEATVAFTGTETSFTMMPYLAGVAFSAGTPAIATWSSLPASYTIVGLYLSKTTVLAQQSEVTSELDATATKGWVDVHGATSIGFDPATGYDPAWSLGSNYDERLQVEDDSTSISYATGIGQQVGP